MTLLPSGQMRPGAVPVRCGMMVAPSGHVGLAGVVGRHGAASGLEEAGDDVHDGLVADELDPHHVGNGLAGDVILRGPEPAADDDAVAAGQRGAEGQRDPLVVVAHRLMEMRGHAGRGQPVAQPRRVGVGNLSEQELGADSHDLDSHVVASVVDSVVDSCAARRPSKKYCSPVYRVRAVATQTMVKVTV